MSPVHLKDLPPKVRRLVGDGDIPVVSHPAAGKQTAPPVKTPLGKSARGRWRCHQCGAVFGGWAAAERHRHPSGIMGGLVGDLELVLCVRR